MKGAMKLFPKVRWGIVWIEGYHLKGYYDRELETISLDYERIETPLEYLRVLTHEFLHYAVNKLNLPRKLDVLIG